MFRVHVHNPKIDDIGDFRMVKSSNDLRQAVNMMDALSFPESKVIVKDNSNKTVASWHLGIRRIPSSLE